MRRPTDQEMMVLENVVCYSSKRQGHTLYEGPPGEEPGSLRDGDRKGTGRSRHVVFRGTSQPGKVTPV